MRTLLVVHRYPPFGVTGVERVAEHTARALTAGGDHVTVLTRRETAAPPFPRLQRAEREGIDVVMISGGGPLHGRFPKLSDVLERMFELTLLDCQPDIVLISHLVDHSPGYVAIAHRWNVPVIYELHDYHAVCERERLQRRDGKLCRGPEGGRACAAHCFPEQRGALERWALRTHMFRHAVEQADALIAPSQFVADYFAGRFPAALPKLRVIGNGVEARPHPAASLPREGPLHVAYAGALAPHKGIDVLIEAMRKAALPHARLTLFGVVVQPYLSQLLKAGDEIENLELRVFGPYDPSELPLLLSDVDVVVVPSIWSETYSIVIREALACGVPVIASRIGALPEGLREGQNGLLFDAGSSTQLATHLQMLDADRSRLEALRAGIRPSDWMSAADRTEQLRALMVHVLARRSRQPLPSADFEELSNLRETLVATQGT